MKKKFPIILMGLIVIFSCRKENSHFPDHVKKSNSSGKVNTQYEVVTIAGGAAGYKDGKALNSQFHEPNGIDISKDGDIYITDVLNHKIRKIDRYLNVSTLAGSENGYLDGLGVKVKFQTLGDITLDTKENAFVTEYNLDQDGISYHNRIRKVSKLGVVSTLVNDGLEGYEDNKFWLPSGIDIDNNGELYVADVYGGVLKKVDIHGKVTALFEVSMYPVDVAVCKNGSIFTAGGYLNVLYRFKNGTNSKFSGCSRSEGPFCEGPVYGEIESIAVDEKGNLYIAQSGDYRIKMVDASRNVIDIVGDGSLSTGINDDGIGENSKIGLVGEMAVKGKYLYFTEKNTHKIRRITLED